MRSAGVCCKWESERREGMAVSGCPLVSFLRRESRRLSDQKGLRLAEKLRIPRLPASGATTLPLPPNDPFIEAIAERVRGVIERQAARDLEAIARSLALPEQDFRRLIEDRERMIDVGFLIDLLAAMVRVFGLDPQWLLVGTYHAGSHRLALELVETSGHTGEHTLREFLHEQYRRLRAGLGPWFLTAQ